MSTQIVKAACPHDCPDTCAMEVTVEARAGTRVAIKVAGSAAHPNTAGALCTKVSRYLERTYHPQRVLRPLRRVGRKGEGRFVEVSWDEALDDIAARLRAIAAVDPQRIVPYSYAGTMGLVQGESMAQRFFHKLGASLLDRTICATAGGEGLNYTLGTRTGTDPAQFENSRLIIFWGCNAIASNLHLWTRAQEAKRRGAKLIAIDPYRSLTAEKCHQHIALLPGTDGALALGLIHVLIREGWLDRDYIDRHTLGFDALAERAAQFDPVRAAALCGITAAEIEQLAHDYWHTRPAAIRLNYGMQRAAGGGSATRAIACLPALAGHWRDPAGGLLLSTSGLFDVDTDVLARPDLLAGRRPRTINMSTIGHDLLRAQPPIDALIVYNSNPVARWWPASRATTCSPWCSSTFVPTPPTLPTTCCRPPRSLSTSTWSSPTGTSTSLPTIRPSIRWVSRCPTPRSSAGWRRAWGFTSPALPTAMRRLRRSPSAAAAPAPATTGKSPAAAAGSGSTCRRPTRRLPKETSPRRADAASSSRSAWPTWGSTRCPATCHRTKGRSAGPIWRSAIRWR
jgi:hypothetical protein